MLHTCFNYSTAGSLRQTLKALGRDEFVLAHHDNLAAGPITDVTGDERKSWFLSSMNFADGSEREFWDNSVKFWQQVVAAQNDGLMVWLSRRCSLEVAWFSHLMSILRIETRFQIADFTNEFQLPDKKGKLVFSAASLGWLNPKKLERGFAIAREVIVSDFSSDISNWKLLQSENAPLRVFKELHLVSAPVNYFDSIILKYATREWQPAAYIVGKCLIDEENQPNTVEVSDIWLFDRLWHLVDVGFLETEDEPSSPKSKVRLKTK